MGNGFREEHGSIFREVALVKDQKKLRSIRSKPLNGMGKASGKEPKIAFSNVTDEHGAIGIHNRDPGIAIEHVSPFVGGVPVHLAIAAGSERMLTPAISLEEGRTAVVTSWVHPPCSTRFLTRSKEYQSGTTSP